MAFLRAKPIGVMQMIDQGEQDDKVKQFFTSLLALKTLTCFDKVHNGTFCRHQSFRNAPACI